VTVYFQGRQDASKTYPAAVKFTITAGFPLVQTEGAHPDIAAFAPGVWSHAEIVQ